MRVDEYRRMQARHASGGRFALLSRLPDSRNGEFTDAVGGATATSVWALWAYVYAIAARFPAGKGITQRPMRIDCKTFRIRCLEPAGKGKRRTQYRRG